MIDKFTDSKVANELAEPIIPSLFEVQIIPHPNLGLGGVPIEIATEQIKSIGGLDAFEKVPELIEQTIGPGTKALFPGVQLDQVVEMPLTFNVNLRGDDGTEATTFVALKKMKDRQFNRASGARGMKRDAIFTVIVRRLTKDKKVWWVGTMENCLFTAEGIAGLDEVNIETDDAATLTCTFRSDKNKVEIASTI